MLVDRTSAQFAAPRQRNYGLPESAQKGPHQIIRSPQLADQVKRRFVRGYLRSINSDCISVQFFYNRAKLSENVQHGLYIGDVRNIFNRTGALRQNCSGNDRERSVFASADRKLSPKRLSPCNYEFTQNQHPL